MQTWESDHKESWALKNWCFWSVVLEKTLKSPLDNEEIKPINPKENQRWIFIGRTDAEAEAPILWPPDVKSQLIGKDPDAGKDWGHEGWQRMKWLDGFISSMDMSLSKLQEKVKGSPKGVLHAVHRVARSWIWLNDWTTTVDNVISTTKLICIFVRRQLNFLAVSAYKKKQTFPCDHCDAFTLISEKKFSNLSRKKKTNQLRDILEDNEIHCVEKDDGHPYSTKGQETGS